MAKQAVEKLAESHPKWGEVIWSRFNKGNYQVHNEDAPDEYDEYYSEMSHGWLISSDQTNNVVATFARGENGNDVYDPKCDGLHVWMQGDEISLQNENIINAAKKLIYKSIGFGEFKNVVRANI